MIRLHRPPRVEAEPIGTLVTRAIEDGKAYARAEIDFYKHMALVRVAGLKVAAIFAVVAIFLVQSSLTTLLIGVGLALASWLGVAGGVLAAAVLGFVISGLLLWLAVRRLSASNKEAVL